MFQKKICKIEYEIRPVYFITNDDKIFTLNYFTEELGNIKLILPFLYSFIFSIILLIELMFLNSNTLAKTKHPLAILSRINGEVKAGPSKKLSEGFNGKMLWKNHHIKTQENSSTTIYFVDGSEIRLFGKSKKSLTVQRNVSEF